MCSCPSGESKSGDRWCPKAAICFRRRGPNIRNGNPNSTTNTNTVDAFWNHSGRLHHVPGDRRRQGLCLIVHRERRQVAPGRIVAEQFDRAGFEHEPEEQPPEQDRRA